MILRNGANFIIVQVHQMRIASFSWQIKKLQLFQQEPITLPYGFWQWM